MKVRSHRISESVMRALEHYAARLRAKFGGRVSEVRLFGSHARGEAHEDSDVDVLVLIDELRDDELGVATGEVAYSILATSTPLSPLVLSTAHFEGLLRQERLLALDIRREGISL